MREEQKRRRRERISRVALRLFAERGFEATTVVSIAQAAGVSRGTFFNYYPYKEAILIEHAAAYLERLEAAVGRLSRPSALESLRAIFDELAGFAETNRALILPLSYELLNPDPARSRAAFEAIPLTRLLHRILACGLKQGCIRGDFSLERLARTLADIYFLTALQWAAYRPQRSIREELRTALKLALEGIAS